MVKEILSAQLRITILLNVNKERGTELPTTIFNWPWPLTALGTLPECVYYVK